MRKNTNKVVLEQMKKLSESMKDTKEVAQEQRELIEKFSELTKDMKEDLREQQELKQDGNLYGENKKDVTQSTEVPRDIKPSSELRSTRKNTNKVVLEQMKKLSESMKDTKEVAREQQELMEKFSELMKDIKEDLREQQELQPEQNDNSYSENKKDMTQYMEVPCDIQLREEIQKILEKCFESRMSHKYSEFEIIESRGVSTSSNGKVAMRGGVKFFIKQLDHGSAQAFITEVIAGPLYRLILFGKSPKIWLIDDDQGQVYLGSEFLPNFNEFVYLYSEARDKSEIRQNYSEKQAQHKFKEELQKSLENSKYFAKFLAACLIFREFDLNFGNFGLIEINETGIAERKWAKIDHGLSFDYTKFNDCISDSDNCSKILEFYLQKKNYHKNTEIDKLIKEVLVRFVDYGELSEELNDMCNFLDKNKIFIEQLIDKQIEDFIKILGHAHYNIEFTICKDTFVYDDEKHIFVDPNDTEQYKSVADQGNKFNKCFKEMLYDQVKKAKEFSSIKDNDQTMYLGSKLGGVQSISHSQSLSSLHSSNSDFEVISISQFRSMYPGSELSEVQPILHSQSLSSLHSSDSDFEVISTSQCR